MGRVPGPAGEAGSEGAAFFDELGDALAVGGPASEHDRSEMARSAPLEIGPGRHPTEDASGSTLAALGAGIARGLQMLRDAAARAETVHGWQTNTAIGTYGDDTLTRAMVARMGWGANVPEEAVYPVSRSDAEGAPYDGSRPYVMHFEPDALPPVEAERGFWSLTVYGPDMFFVRNAEERYAINDRSEGLEYNADGSLDIHLQPTPPEGREGNWLPTPEGPFVLMARIYLPLAPVIEGRYALPGVRAIGAD